MSAEGTSIEVGDLIDDRYRIESSLGQGGMGRVYRAEHVGIKRPVAIKLLHHELREDEDINERLMREAFATGRLDHPNCVSITDSGTLDDGTTYLVMELLRGQSLGDELDERGTLPVVQTLEIAAQVLRGLGHAHSVGVVHRDLKPENIFLVRQDDDEIIAKILDFGIAKLLGDAREEAGGNDLTQAGMAIGSPTYMSPEQATGAELDGRTDLYSLSIVLYEMLTGEPPFYEPDDKVRSLQRRLKEDPPVMKSPSGGAVPTGVELLVRKGLARMPDDRIPSAKVYLDEVRALLAELRPEETGAVPGVDPQTPVLPPQLAGAPALGHAPTRLAVNPDASPVGATPGLTDRQKRIAMIGGGVTLALILLIAALAGQGGKSLAAGEGDELVMKPDHLEDEPTEDPAILAERLQANLVRLRKEIDAGRGRENIRELQRLQSLWPEEPQTNYLLGLAYMEKRFWRDGFEHLRKALSLDPELREEPVVIKAALRALTSRSKPELGIRFLVRDVGQPAIPYLQETVKGGSKRQREHAGRALRRLQAAKL